MTPIHFSGGVWVAIIILVFCFLVGCVAVYDIVFGWRKRWIDRKWRDGKQ